MAAPPTSYPGFDYTTPQRLATIPSEGSGSPALATGGPGGYQTPAARYAKRKASDLDSVSAPDDSPPKGPPQTQRGSTSSGRAKGKTRFNITPDQYEQRPVRRSSGSGTSNVPTSYRDAKRARLSTSTSTHPNDPSTSTTATAGPRSSSPKPPSLASTSIPISALLSPHAPSLAPSQTFHMRDPRKPRVQATPWTVRIADKPPVHCWLFIVGFLCPLCWVAGGWVFGVPTTRKLSGEVEGGHGKEMVLDDPQVEHDARTWRRRNRWAAFVALFTYLPFIIIVAYFGSRA